MSDATLEQTENVQQGIILTVILERATNNWCAYTPDDIGVVVATGATRDETIEEFRSALKSHFRVMQDQGMTVPNVTQLEIRETLAA